MFYKSSDIKKEVKVKMDIVANGYNADKLITSVIKYSEVTLVVAPSDKQEEFVSEFNTHKAKNGRVKKTVYEIELKSGELKDYVLISKKDYEKFLSFEKTKMLDVKQIEMVKKESLKGNSQRNIAKKLGISHTTVNRILNNKY